MTATREHRNLGHVEDACASVGTALTVAEDMLGILTGHLPDDVDEAAVHIALANVRAAHNELQAVLGV